MSQEATTANVEFETQQPTMNVDNEIIEVTGTSTKTNVEKRKNTTRSFIPKDSTGKVDISSFTDEELKLVQSLGSKLNKDDVNSIANFGVDTQNKLATQSENLLKEVRNYDSGEMSDMLNDLMDTMAVAGTNKTADTLRRIPLIGPALGGLVRRVKVKAEQTTNRYESLSGNVNKISTNLDKSRLTIAKDNSTLAELEKKNVEFMKQLREYGIAGAIILEQVKEEYAEMLKNPDNYEQHEISAKQMYIERLAKRLHNMEITHTVTFQSLPQIHQVQQNNSLMMEQIQSTLVNTIPVWKNQLVLSTTIARQEKNALTNKKVNETTNKMLALNSQTLKDNSIMIAELNEESVVSTDTINIVTNNILDTIKQLDTIKAQGAKNREEATKALDESRRAIEEALKMS